MSRTLPWVFPLAVTLLCWIFMNPAGSVALGLGAGWTCGLLARFLLLRNAHASWRRFGFAFLYAMLIHGAVFLCLSCLVFLKLHAPLPLLISFSAVAMAGTIGVGCAFPRHSDPGQSHAR